MKKQQHTKPKNFGKMHQMMIQKSKDLRGSLGKGLLYAGPKDWTPAQMSSSLLQPKLVIQRPPLQVRQFLEKERALPRGTTLSILPKPWKCLARMTKMSWQGRFLKAWRCGSRWTRTWTSRLGRREERSQDGNFHRKNCLAGSDWILPTYSVGPLLKHMIDWANEKFVNTKV